MEKSHSNICKDLGITYNVLCVSSEGSGGDGQEGQEVRGIGVYVLVDSGIRLPHQVLLQQRGGVQVVWVLTHTPHQLQECKPQLNKNTIKLQEKIERGNVSQ